VAHVLADQVVAGHRDEVALAQVAQLAQQLAHPHGQGRLARAGAAGEAHVQAGPGRAEPVPAAELVDEQQRRDLPDPGLDRGEPDEVAVQLGQDRGDVQRLLFRGDVDRRVRGQRARVVAARPVAGLAVTGLAVTGAAPRPGHGEAGRRPAEGRAGEGRAGGIIRHQLPLLPSPLLAYRSPPGRSVA
jgi:hypothetical protein